MTPIERYKTILAEHQIDRQTAATLVLAEGIDRLVQMLANVDEAVIRIEGTAHANTPVNIQEDAVKFIQDRYLDNPSTRTGE